MSTGNQGKTHVSGIAALTEQAPKHQIKEQYDTSYHITPYAVGINFLLDSMMRHQFK